MKNHSIQYNFIMNFILTTSQFLFPLITFPYVSRVLMAAGNGRVSFAVSVSNYFIMVASLGIPTYGIRACAQVKEDREKLSKTVQELFFINAFVTTLVALTYFLCVFTVSRMIQDQTLFLINGINVVLNMFGMNWVYQALEQYDYITVRSIAFKILSIILMILLVHKQEDYIIYGGILVFASVGSYVLNFIRIRHFVDFRFSGDYNFLRHIKPILILFSQSLAVSIYTNLDTVMLGFMKTDVDVGYYNAAVKIKSVLLSVVTSLGNVLLPRMSYYAKLNQMDTFRRIMRKALNFTVMLSLPMVFYFVFFADESIRFLAGAGYAGAVLAMQIITFAVIPNGLTGVLGVQVLTALEKEKYVLISVIVGAMTDFILNLVFIPRFAAAGAALATMIAEYLVLLVQVYYTRDLLSAMWREFRFHVYLAGTLLGSLLSVFIVRIAGIDTAFLLLLVSGIVFFGCYGMILLVAKEEVLLDNVGRVLKRFVKKPN